MGGEIETAGLSIAGGGPLHRCLPVFSSDGDTILLACGGAIMAYSTSTAELLYTLQHAAEVASLCAHPVEPALLFSATRDGTLTLWDLDSGLAARQWTLYSAIEGLVVTAAFTGACVEGTGRAAAAAL